MADIYQGCYSCGKNCIETAFCSEGGGYDNNETGGISVPRNFRVKITANPAFWGFSGVLIEGWAHYENGYFDYFDGFDADHSVSKSCGPIITGPLTNEQRPDVFYRSVYDPDTDTSTHYGSDGIEDGVNRGGAEIYLVDRMKGLVQGVSSDRPSCDTVEATQVYKKFPENFGFGNKINFNESLYKNATSAWRMIDFSGCYDSTINDSGQIDCSGNEKDHIVRDSHYLEKYEAFNTRVAVLDCTQDGAVAPPYSGGFTLISGLTRDTGVSYLASVNLELSPALKDGMSLVLSTAPLSFTGKYVIQDVAHGVSTTANLLGTWGLDNFSYNMTSDNFWVAINTHDPSSCCGEAAYGVDSDSKIIPNETNYHIDFGRAFNNDKNKIQSNRLIANRDTYGTPPVLVSSSGYRQDRSYPSVTSSGTIDSVSGVPVFEKDLPYYGPFFETDRFDTETRTENKYNRVKGRNATCYSKHASLEIFPDCLTQYEDYSECDTETAKFKTNRLSRLAFVYRGCDFYDPCEFDESGRPYSAPTGIADLKRGLAGQEMYMYLNMNQAFGGLIAKCACGCSNPVPGQNPPEMVEIASPVSFPCLFNFDLHPERYGCNDSRYQLQKYKEFVSTIFEHETCDAIPELPESCNVRQPYTTYGFIRNLCGKETQSRKDVITEAFAKLKHAGTYRDTTPNVDIAEPMYWNFVDTGPSPDLLGSGTWNGQTTGDNSIHTSGDYPYWGLADNQGRLVAPYFRPKVGDFSCCATGPEIPYVDFDTSGTFYNGWPTDNVPFLIELESTDICVGCTTTTMPVGNLVLTLSGGDTKYSHNKGVGGGKYGYNNCRYSGTAIDPTYSCLSGIPTSFCGAGADTLHSQFATPYTGNTCSCITGSEVTLYTKTIGEGLHDLAVGWISSGINSSYVEMTGCNDITSSYLNVDYANGAAGGVSVYASFKLACPENIDFLTEPSFPFAFYEGDSVSNLWSCRGDSCPSTYPSPGNRLSLSSKMLLIGDARKSDFEALTEAEIEGPSFSDILTNGVLLGDPIHARRNIQLCSGEKVLIYGCYVGGGFYGCGGSCDSESVCVSCSGQGVGCNDCGAVVSFSGIATSRIPAHFELNPCFCQCSSPTLMRIYGVDSSGGSLVLETTYENTGNYDCNGIPYWYSISGENRVSIPVLLNQLPPFPHMGEGPYSSTATDFCSFDSGPNKIASGIQYKFYEPNNANTCGNLDPYSCDNGICADSRSNSANCGNPIYTTGNVIDISVNKKACWPEIMIVNKVECYGSGYALHVSREYHNHDRTWQEVKAIEGGSACFTKYYGSYVYDSGCQTIPYAVPTDSVTPAFSSVCGVHYPSGANANQDFLFTGDSVWNYYNLFYESGYPAGYQFDTAIDGVTHAAICGQSGGGSPALEAIFGTGNYAVEFGTLAVNAKHSCLQDIRACGADFFCNKMFFPRRKYAEGTKVSAYGALSMCTDNARPEYPSWYSGYGSFSSLPEIIKGTRSGRILDACDPDSVTIVNQEVGIDDSIIYVNDYLPLIGVTRQPFRGSSCLIPNSGECNSVTLPYTHTDQTMTYSVGDMGYYTSILASGASNCLFDKFKILVDVNCCPDRTRRRDNSLEEPTSLSYMFTDIPSIFCKGFVSEPPCGCVDSECSDPLSRPGSCKQVYALYVYDKITCTGVNYGVFPPDLYTDYVIDYDGTFLQASDAEGYRESCSDPATGFTLYQTECPEFSGKYLEASSAGYVPTWECGENVYSLAPGDANSDCCFFANTTLCSALSSGVTFPKTQSCYVGLEANFSDDLSSPSGIWMAECGCSAGGDNICLDDSLIYAVITEA